MNIYPDSLFEDIEFNQVIAKVMGLSKGLRAKEHLNGASPYSDFDLWSESLYQVNELCESKRMGISLNISEYSDIRHYFDRLQIENYTLSVEEVLEIKGVLQILEYLENWGKQTETKELHITTLYISQIPQSLLYLLGKLNTIFEPDGSVSPKATPDLGKLYQKLNRIEKTINSVFQTVLNKYKKANVLTEPYESYKNGRRVLCVAIENKRRIGGIIQDESSSGQTVYIEPDEMIVHYRDKFNLQSEVRQEINRIIRQICEEVREVLFDLREGYLILTGVDIINSKADLGVLLNGNLPKLRKSPYIKWYQAYHPLLLEKNTRESKVTVPFELDLVPPNKMVLLSGPNAGGKSVLLKAVALNQVMVQSGFLIPVDPNSECGLFSGFFADIGDQQSLEEDLSTYSSHLRNMKTFIDLTDSHSLVFIDEMGSGTDPQYGGAISEAVLHQLNHKKVWGVITTHYFNLKMFADKQKGLQNAAMSFDKRNLEPTYRFLLGKPGSSFAFEIAKKTGLDNRIIEYAKKKSGKNKWAIEEMLVELENEKNKIEKKERDLESDKKQLEQLLKSNKALSNELTFQKKKWKVERKKEELAFAEKNRKEVRAKLKELERKENISEARKLEEEIKNDQKSIASEIEKLSENMVRHEKIPKDFFKTLKVGDFVKYKDTGSPGEILSIRKNKVEVQMGAIKMTVNRKDLRPGKEPLKIQRNKNVKFQLKKKKEEMETKIDIRGYSISEANKELEQFLDEATIANVMELRILHGKGTGVLKRLVREKLREYKHVRDIYHPEPEKGGDGITIVKFG